MSENRVIKELGLEDFFDFLLNSSQDDRSNSSRSYGKKSHVYDQEIEKPRGIALDNKYQAESAIKEKILDIPGIRVFGSPGTPSVFQKKPISDSSGRKFGENMENGTFPQISIRGASSGAKTPNTPFESRQLDAEFLKFDPTIYHTSQKTVKSDNNEQTLQEKLFPAKSSQESKASPVQNDRLVRDEWAFGNSNVEVKNNMEPKMEEEGVRKKRTNSFDEEDFDTMDMILEEAKKSSNGDNSVQMIGGEGEEQQKPLDISPPEVNLNGVVEDRTPEKQFNKKQNDITPMSNKPTSISKSSIERLKEVVFEADPSAQKVFTEKDSSTSPSIKLFGSSNSETPSRQRSSQEFSITKSKIVQLDKVQIKSKLSPAVKAPEILDGFTQEDLDFLDQQLNDNKGENTQMEIEEPLIGSRKPSNSNEENQKKFSQEEFKIRVNNGPVLVTGMGKPLTTNNNNLEKVKHLFEDNDDNDYFKSLLDTPTQKDEGDEPVLMTASRKPIPINDEKFEVVQKLFENDDSQEEGDDEKNMFSFKTASMKPAKFDTKKLDSYQDLFEDNSLGNSQEENIGFTTVKERLPIATVETQKEECSFKTASMKPATFDPKKLDSFKNLFEENSQEDIVGFSSIKQSAAAANIPTQKEEFSFKTASMKPTMLDTKKTGSFKHLFEDNSPENSQAENTGGFTIGKQAAANIPAQKEELSFKTASMKPVAFDTQRLDSFKNFFQDDNSAGNSQDDFGFTTAGNNQATTTNEVFSFGTIKEPADGQNLFSFTTASMKPVKFDTKRLDSFKDMFEGNSQENSIGFGTARQAVANAPTQKEEFSFQTASMKPVTFDTNKLDSFKNLFEDDNSGENSQNGDIGFTKAAAPQKEDVSFKTASMKPVTFDTKKLDSFKNLFEENSQEGMSNGFQPALTTSSNKENGEPSFKMGNMKPAKFDTSKLQSFKNIFEDDFDEGEDTIQFGNAGGASNDMPVLMTASRKAIPVDMEKIKFAENLLKDEGSSDGGEKSKKVTFKTAKNNEDEEPMIQTASRKQVTVNIDKLKKFQDLFDQDDDEEESMNTKKSTSMFEETKSVSNGRHHDNSRDFMMNDRAKSNHLPLENKNSMKNNFSIQGGGKKLGYGSAGAEAIMRLFGGGSTDRTIPQTTNPMVSDVSQKKFSPNPTKQTSPTVSRGSPISNKFNKDMTQQGVKKVLTKDLRVTNKGKETTLNPGLTPILTQKVVGAGEGKKKNGFKFVKETGDGSKTVGSPTPGEKNDKNKFKRNYIEFSKDNKKEPLNENLFKENAKVQRHARKIKPKKNYFFKDNYKTHPLETAIKEHVGINISNSLDYKFICSCALYFQSQSAYESPSNEICCCNGTLAIGWSELRDALLKDGLNEDFLTEEWVKTHYRMIVWKLVSIERRLFLSSPSKKLTFANVKAELEYRYFVEYCEGRRSALLRVIQQDPIPSNHFVLLVGEIISTPQKSYLVELSDGWYSVYFEVKPEGSFTGDKYAMTNNQLLYVLIKFKKLYSGMKIHLFGINLRKSKSDLPSDENEGTQKNMIDVSYNCISKAKWNEKLGLARNRPLFLLKNLFCVKTQGGMIPELDVYVLKKYKLLETSTKAGLRQFHEESGEEGKRIFFRLRVVDSILFFGAENKQQKLKDLYCEIEITGTLCQMYDEIRENDRIRLRYFDGNFSANTRHHKDFKYYDHETGKIYTKYLFLKSNRISQLETSSASSFLKQNLAPYKEFFKQNFKSSLLLNSLSLNPQSIAALNQKDLRRINNEIDVVGIILKPTPHKIDGCLSNGDFFQIMVHSNTFFSNQKSLEKNNAVIYFRNLQLLETEYVAAENVHCHLLKTNDYSFLAPLQNSVQSETDILNAIVRDKGQLEMNREKLNRAIKKP